MPNILEAGWGRTQTIGLVFSRDHPNDTAGSTHFLIIEELMRVARQFGVRLLLDSVGQSDTADTYLKLARTKSIDGLILFDLRGAPTAVFITSDVVAFGALAAIHQRGQAIPDEIAVVGFDDNPLARFMRPPLTTVRISFENMGHQAGKMLLDRIIHNVEPVRQVLLDAELIVRASSVRSNHPSSRPHTAETETP